MKLLIKSREPVNHAQDGTENNLQFSTDSDFRKVRASLSLKGNKKKPKPVYIQL
jgi:hypothetical protein